MFFGAKHSRVSGRNSTHEIFHASGTMPRFPFFFETTFLCTFVCIVFVPKVMLVYFIGGVTYMEIAALRFLNKQRECASRTLFITPVSRARLRVQQSQSM